VFVSFSLQAVSGPFCFSLTSITCFCGNPLAGHISFHLLHHVEKAFYLSAGGNWHIGFQHALPPHIGVQLFMEACHKGSHSKQRGSQSSGLLNQPLWHVAAEAVGGELA
jgi:hypothetical protein